MPYRKSKKYSGYINTKKSIGCKRQTLKEKSWPELRDALDKDFSDFIRMSAADDNGIIRCPTCG